MMALAIGRTGDAPRYRDRRALALDIDSPEFAREIEMTP